MNTQQLNENKSKNQLLYKIFHSSTNLINFQQYSQAQLLHYNRGAFTTFISEHTTPCLGISNIIQLLDDIIHHSIYPVNIVINSGISSEEIDKYRKQFNVEIVELAEEMTGNHLITDVYGNFQNQLIPFEEVGTIIHDGTCPLLRQFYQQIEQEINCERQLILIGNNNCPIYKFIEDKYPSHVTYIRSNSDFDTLDYCKEYTITLSCTNMHLIDDSLLIELHRLLQNPHIIYPNCSSIIERNKAVLDIISHVELLIVVGNENDDQQGFYRWLHLNYHKPIIYINKEKEILDEDLSLYKTVLIGSLPNISLDRFQKNLEHIQSSSNLANHKYVQ